MLKDLRIILRRYNQERRQITGSGTQSDPVIGGFLALEVQGADAHEFHYTNWRAVAGNWASGVVEQLDHQQGRYPYFDPPNDWAEPRLVKVSCLARGKSESGALAADFWLRTSYEVKQGETVPLIRAELASVRESLLSIDKLLAKL